MATSSFERKIVITDPKSIEKLVKIMADDRRKVEFPIIHSLKLKDVGVKHY